jgi:hypothetical protein
MSQPHGCSVHSPTAATSLNSAAAVPIRPSQNASWPRKAEAGASSAGKEPGSSAFTASQLPTTIARHDIARLSPPLTK